MTTDICLVYGPVIAAAVALLKRLPWIGAAIARNPKLVAGLVAVLANGASLGIIPVSAAQWTQLAACVATSFAGAVATHEAVLDPASKAIGIAGARTG